MRNQPFNSIFVDDESGSDSFIDPPAAVRFRLLATAFTVGAVIVLGRIAWVQASLQDRYLQALNTTTEEYELIPARDGRILSESAGVFATDVDQYSVQVHYRWLQQPVDPDWMKREIRSNLSRDERRDAATVEHFRTTRNMERRDMWQQLIQITELSRSGFEAQQKAIQTRVTRIADSVNRRHQEITEPDASDNADGILMKIASSVRSALTTTPRRTTSERIVVREEESWHEILSSVPLDVAGRILEQPHLFPGVRVIAGNRRTYPLDTVAPHIVGARTPAKDDEAEQLLGHTPPGTWRPAFGRFGVERTYNHQLQGVPGLRKIVRNRRMEVIRSEIERQPVSGRDVLLTLNANLQHHAEQLLAEALLDQPAKLLLHEEQTDDTTQTPIPIPTGGSIVVMDVITGRILVAASAPGFGLSLYTGASGEEWETARADQRHPFLSRIIQTALPPGSVMKPITGTAAMESGSLNPDEPFQCRGYLHQPDEHRCLIFRLYGRGHNSVDLTRALAASCNVYFFSAAQDTGFGSLRRWCDKFGLGRKTGVDLPFETNGNLPGTSATTAAAERRFRREALGLAIGQSSVTVTPLQMVRAYAAIANGGWLVTPHVVSPDGTARVTTAVDDRPQNLTRRKIAGLSEETLKRVREGMRAVVQEPYGTGYKNVRLEEIAIAGKTGTAETAPGKPDHAWFAGYVPADQPRYAFAVVLEHGGSGSRAAGPLAREVVRKMTSLGLLNP